MTTTTLSPTSITTELIRKWAKRQRAAVDLLRAAINDIEYGSKEKPAIMRKLGLAELSFSEIEAQMQEVGLVE